MSKMAQHENWWKSVLQSEIYIQFEKITVTDSNPVNDSNLQPLSSQTNTQPFSQTCYLAKLNPVAVA